MTSLLLPLPGPAQFSDRRRRSGFGRNHPWRSGAVMAKPAGQDMPNARWMLLRPEGNLNHA